MKVTLFLLALLLFAGCDDRKDKKDVSDDKDKKEDNTPRVEPEKEPDFYIAFKEDQGKTVYLTDSDEDVDRLIVDLRPLGVEVALLERPYWRESRCRKMSARKCVQGDCVVGNCALTEVGGWNVCRCQ